MHVKTLPVLFEICVKSTVVKIYLKKDISQTACIYLFFFVTRDCEKIIFVTGDMKKKFLKNFGKTFSENEKLNETRNLQKFIGVRGWDPQKVKLKKHFMLL